MIFDIAMYALGVACLAGMGGVSALILGDALVVERHRILAALRGEPIPPAASGAPNAPALLQRRGVEAAAAPTIQVR